MNVRETPKILYMQFQCGWFAAGKSVKEKAVKHGSLEKLNNCIQTKYQ